MAETDKKTETASKAEPAAAKALSNEQLAKLAKRATVRVQVTDKKTGDKSVVELPIAADHIISHRVAGESIFIVTVDGQKIEAAA